MVDILNYTFSELEHFVKEDLQEPAFRAKQVWHWLWHKRVRSFSAMNNISRTLYAKLEEYAEIIYPEVISTEKSIDGTVKLLLSFTDNTRVETVLIPAEGKNGETRVTQCVSTQVGCAMGCTFCSTATLGFSRNLSMREIVAQVLLGKEYYDDVRNAYPIVRNIVFMGMGEPFLNYSEVMRSLEVLGDSTGLNFSPNKMIVSTSGIMNNIIDFGKRSLGCLAISLHGTTQEQRERIMPKASTVILGNMLDILEEYSKASKSYITLEYLLLSGINDSMEDAKRLCAIAKRLGAKVNLLEYNAGLGASFTPSPRKTIIAFEKELWAEGVVTVLRLARGRDISAGCGQLALRKKI